MPVGSPLGWAEPLTSNEGQHLASVARNLCVRPNQALKTGYAIVKDLRNGVYAPEGRAYVLWYDALKHGDNFTLREAQWMVVSAITYLAPDLAEKYLDEARGMLVGS